jgi:transcriptional regulator with XRE-family HTH domain
MSYNDEKKTGLFDIKLGNNIVKQRISLGISRKELAGKIGVTHQQLQKYERGLNRISVSRLMEIAKALNLNPENLLNEQADLLDKKNNINKNIVFEINKYINKIEDEAKLSAIKNLVKSICLSEAKNDNEINYL